jgi:tetratricopeptide (TPR) repeat protein
VILFAGGVIALAALVAYANTFSVPFLFDDEPSIIENPTIRHLWPPGPAFAPPRDFGLTVSGRPLVNFSLALNYALSGTNPWSYHALNLAIHVFAGLALFGVVRRSLLRMPVGALVRSGTGAAFRADGVGRSLATDDRPQAGFLQTDATLLAFTIALLWTLHPLQTESVTYVIQRTESLMGLCYLLTLYCFIRGEECSAAGVHLSGTGAAAREPCQLIVDKVARRARCIWSVLSVMACLLGMACKEVMVTAPLIVLLYDRTFLSGSFREAWRRYGKLHLALAATWLLLAWLVLSTGGNRGGTAGFNVGIAWGQYWLTQFEAIGRYLWLSLWPHPLVFEYGTIWMRRVGDVLPWAMAVAAVAAATLIALWRRPALGFLGCWFFAILAPTSLVPGTIQMIVEHRMYLSLAAVVSVAVLGLCHWAGRYGLAASLALAVGLGWSTHRRNEDYRSAQSLWADTLARRPDNARAHLNFGKALAADGQIADATAHYEEAVRLKPDYFEAHICLGNARQLAGRVVEAVTEYEAALRLQPGIPSAHLNLGNALAQLGRPGEAIGHYEAVLCVQPDAYDARFNLGNVLFLLHRLDEGIAQYQIGLRQAPGAVEAHYQLGRALGMKGDWVAAAGEYREALRLQPDYPEARFALGNLLARTGRLSEAIAEYQEILRTHPDDALVRRNLEQARAGQNAASPNR